MGYTTIYNMLLTALAPIIWGSTYIVTTELLPPDRPFTAALIRTLPAGLILILLTTRHMRQVNWWRISVLSALNIGVFQALLFIAAYRLPGGLAAVLGAIQPLLVMALVWLCDRHAPTPLAVFASVIGVIGMAALLLSPDSLLDPVGALAAIAGAACMAAGTYLSQRWKNDLPLMANTGWQLLIGGLMLLPVAMLVDPPLPELGIKQLLGYAYLTLIGAVLSYVLWFRGLRSLPPVAVSSLALLSPLSAAVLGWLLLGERLADIALLGFVTVLISVVLVQWSATQPQRPEQPTHAFRKP
ncbi:EamA family transporter [Pontibacterium granulatum]|uniref:EamA family transporter n=1 Tax=Pontibacterium granulatum TaxID=2036029 RepID=UPI00249C3651|nr:EamA family transporter [Pontibacterium granulatum]MDI3326678.1 EamA family transporter [Pontibacterium granulatum]